MKKMYKHPKMEISKVAPIKIVCASGEFDETNEQISGQAPKRRRTPVF